MIIGNGADKFEWQSGWAKVPDTQSRRENGRTHGSAVTKTGDVVVFRQANPAVLIFDRAGNVRNAWGDRFAGAHGLTLVNENGTEFLWLTDQDTGEVVKTTLDGRTLLNLVKPDLPVYQKGRYSPTWVAVNPQNGDVWVTDGYGTGYIHRYDARGKYLASIAASDGALGGFSCPHGIFFDTRRGAPELYVTDRGHRRIEVFDTQGNFKRVLGSDFLNSPCCFTVRGKELVVPELYGRVAVLDENDCFVRYLGERDGVTQVPDWPNVAPTEIRDGQFNSPHGIACDPKSGDLYVVEWIIGGRITRLQSMG